MRAPKAKLVAPLLGVVLATAAWAGPALADSGGTGSSPITLPLPSPLPPLTLPPVLSLTNPASGVPQINLPTETRTVPEMQAALLADLNRERAAAGLGSLTTQPWAQSVAMAHSADMATARDIWHNYSGFVDVAHQAVNAYVNGENVGMAYTLDQADAALMASPSHRSNILYPLFNEVGIGIARDPIGYVYVTEDFVDIRPPGATASAPAHATTAAQVAATSPTAPAPPTPPAPAVTPAVTPPPAATPIVPPPSPQVRAPAASSGGRQGQPLAAGPARLSAHRSGFPWPLALLATLGAFLVAGLRRTRGRHRA